MAYEQLNYRLDEMMRIMTGLVSALKIFERRKKLILKNLKLLITDLADLRTDLADSRTNLMCFYCK